MNAEICKKANITVAAASIAVLITGIFLSLFCFLLAVHDKREVYPSNTNMIKKDDL